jgi:type I restriction enzyme S subunit
VPAHWEVGSVKYFFEFLDSRRIPLSAEDRGKRTGDFPYYGASGIIDYIDDYIFDEDLVLVSEDGANLLARSSPIAFVARGKYWVNNHAHILRPKDCNIVFWAEVIEANQLNNFITGAAQPKFTSEALGSLTIASPPSDQERAAIESYILRATRGIHDLYLESLKVIDYLKERRSALISAAVTGKIDVRDWQPPADESAFDEKVRQAGMEAEA